MIPTVLLVESNFGVDSIYLERWTGVMRIKSLADSKRFECEHSNVHLNVHSI